MHVHDPRRGDVVLSVLHMCSVDYKNVCVRGFYHSLHLTLILELSLSRHTLLHVIGDEVPITNCMVMQVANILAFCLCSKITAQHFQAR